MQQRIAADQIERKRRRIFEPADVALAHRGHEQPEAGDGDGVGVQVHAMHRSQGAIHQFPIAGPRFLGPPVLQDPGESAEQKVPAAARRVDHFEDVSGQWSVVSCVIATDNVTTDD